MGVLSEPFPHEPHRFGEFGSWVFHRDVLGRRKGLSLPYVLFFGECETFTLSGLKKRLEPYKLDMTDDELREELSHYVENGQLDARIDGWAIRKRDASRIRWDSLVEIEIKDIGSLSEERTEC